MGVVLHAASTSTAALTLFFATRIHIRVTTFKTYDRFIHYYLYIAPVSTAIKDHYSLVPLVFFPRIALLLPSHLTTCHYHSIPPSNLRLEISFLALGLVCIKLAPKNAKMQSRRPLRSVIDMVCCFAHFIQFSPLICFRSFSSGHCARLP